MNTQSPFQNVVFAGGGSRCLWQVGFWSVAAPELNLKPDVVAGVSAGAAMACVLLAGTAEPTLELFKSMTGNNSKNFYFTRLFSDMQAFPHEKMYRAGLRFGLDEASFKKLKKGPEIRITISRLPGLLGPAGATFYGIIIYYLEKLLKQPLHPSFGLKSGYKPEFYRVSDCETPEELENLIFASSSTPPITPMQIWKGAPALDGGFVDNAPVFAVEDCPGRTLVLLTRRYKDSAIPLPGKKVYVQPSQPIPVSKWDYTNPEGLQKAYELGKKDAESFLKVFTREPAN
ncbi:MAG TPA: patatin-like phospholipase family protein [Spirochaetota bacterium]|nr:patatin-like phospholipase family protein [Spirochaetota bacterium]